MGCFGSKQKISKVDLEYLKKHTRYDEATIKEWFKGFRVSHLSFYSFRFLFIFFSFSFRFLFYIFLSSYLRFVLYSSLVCAY